MPYQREYFDVDQMTARSMDYYQRMDQRRTVRDFSDKEIPKTVVDNIILTASTAPSGANKQPWTFCVVHDVEIKRQIRIEAEKEEYENYHGRMPEDWLVDLKPLQTDWQKPFIEVAPCIIVVFKKIYDVNDNGEKETIITFQNR